MMICQCALTRNIVIADKLFQKMPLPDEIPLQSHYLIHAPYIYTHMCVLIVVLLLNPGTQSNFVTKSVYKRLQTSPGAQVLRLAQDSRFKIQGHKLYLRHSQVFQPDILAQRQGK